MQIDFFYTAGIVSLIYFFCIIIYVGPRRSFHYIWLMLGSAGCLTGFLSERGYWETLPFSVRAGTVFLTGAGCLVFFIMEICIFTKMWAVPAEEPDYIIVLGACIRGTRVTRSLSYRLKKAAQYAKKHPNVMLIVSGGQGPGEDITEAQAMDLYLQKLGIAGERILREDKSVSTRENLLFSRKILIEDYERRRGAVCVMDSVKIAVCSNNFHIYRAMQLAKAAADWKVMGLAAMTDPFMWLSFTVREGAALFKEIIFGHLR